MRYRGAKWSAQLGGKVLFGDHVKGTLWAATVEAEGVPPVVETLCEGLPTGFMVGLSNIFTDSAGEIYLLCLNGTNQDGGTIRKIKALEALPEPPALLSQTGLFNEIGTLAPHPALIPYDVASPLWSDGAEKHRWICVPKSGSRPTAAEQIAFSDTGNWSFPPGTIFVKHFEMRIDEREPALVRRLETRVIVCTEGGGKYGLTYRWNVEGTDAQLISWGETDVIEIVRTDGTSSYRLWNFPSRAECMQCHTAASGQSLGLRTHQLNRDFFYEATGRTANQLETLNDLRLLNPPVSSLRIRAALAARSLDDATAPLEHRVRSYLDSNCSHCHQPGGGGPAFDARLQTPLQEQNLVNGLLVGHHGAAMDRVLKPGDPVHSAALARMATAGDWMSMPPIAKNVVDARAVELLESYILGLDPSEFEGAERPARCSMSGPEEPVAGHFDVTVVFDKKVVDFNDSDFLVEGASLVGMRGGGYYYVATFQPEDPGGTAPITISIPTNAVDATGNGSLAPDALVVATKDVLPPTTTFGLPRIVGERLVEIDIEFSEPVVGVDAGSIIAVGGNVESIQGEGANYTLTARAFRQNLNLRIDPEQVSDLAGNSLAGAPEFTWFIDPTLPEFPAATFSLVSGFTVTGDTDAEGVHHEVLLVENDSRGGDISKDSGFMVIYPFSIPVAGDYVVRGLVRADDPESASFYIGFNGEPAPSVWLANRQPGEIGSGFYHWGTASATGDVADPLVFHLEAGEHTLELYCRDDGTKIERLQLRPARPTATWDGPLELEEGTVEVSLVFSEPVAGLDLSDIQTDGCELLSLAGEGSAYAVVVRATAFEFSLRMAEGVVTAESGATNPPTEPFRFFYGRSYEKWALEAGLERGTAGYLADPDGNGHPQLVDYAFGLDEGADAAARLPRIDGVAAADGGIGLTITFCRRSDDPALAYVPQFGSGLGDFNDALTEPVVEDLGDGWERVTIRDDVGPPLPKRRFGRVKIVLAPPW